MRVVSGIVVLALLLVGGSCTIQVGAPKIGQPVVNVQCIELVENGKPIAKECEDAGADE